MKDVLRGWERSASLYDLCAEYNTEPGGIAVMFGVHLIFRVTEEPDLQAHKFTIEIYHSVYCSMCKSHFLVFRSQIHQSNSTKCAIKSLIHWSVQGLMWCNPCLDRLCLL